MGSWKDYIITGGPFHLVSLFSLLSFLVSMSILKISPTLTSYHNQRVKEAFVSVVV